jgi:hypothetical protein
VSDPGVEGVADSFELTGSGGHAEHHQGAADAELGGEGGHCERDGDEVAVDDTGDQPGQVERPQSVEDDTGAFAKAGQGLPRGSAHTRGHE